MTGNLNITSGIFLSFIIHVLAFATWHSDFDLTNNAPSFTGINNQISIQLVKYIEPVEKVINKVLVNKVLVNKDMAPVKKNNSSS